MSQERMNAPQYGLSSGGTGVSFESAIVNLPPISIKDEDAMREVWRQNFEDFESMADRLGYDREKALQEQLREKALEDYVNRQLDILFNTRVRIDYSSVISKINRMRDIKPVDDSYHHTNPLAGINSRSLNKF